MRLRLSVFFVWRCLRVCEMRLCLSDADGLLALCLLHFLLRFFHDFLHVLCEGQMPILGLYSVH